MTTALPDGSFATVIAAVAGHTLSLVAIDAAGNRSDATTTIVRTITSLPPGPAILRFEGTIADRVGSGLAQLTADGNLDAVFTLSFSFGSAVTRQLAYVELEGPATRSTRPEAGSTLGVANDLGAPLQNNPNGQATFNLTSSGSLVLFAAREGFLQVGATYTATAAFTNGSRYIGTVTVGAIPSNEVVGPTVSVRNDVLPDIGGGGTGTTEIVGATISVANTTSPDDGVRNYAKCSARPSVWQTSPSRIVRAIRQSLRPLGRRSASPI